MVNQRFAKMQKYRYINQTKSKIICLYNVINLYVTEFSQARYMFCRTFGIFESEGKAQNEIPPSPI